MRVRHVAASVLLSAGLVVLTAGCNTSSLSKQELVVVFYSDAPHSDHVAALKACGHVTPETLPEPMTTSTLPSDQVGDVRFRTDHANDREVAQLEECLNKQPGVEGVDVPDLSN